LLPFIVDPRFREQLIECADWPAKGLDLVNEKRCVQYHFELLVPEVEQRSCFLAAASTIVLYGCSEAIGLPKGLNVEDDFAGNGPMRKNGRISVFPEFAFESF
jgi:hypothetical protein